ncbi:MAG: amidohydrolase family protein [Mesorhizobium sp.]|nr:amidohydrolase family protein [Mesorhizobium sp.]MCO5161238.1 amidohydrolase family protein [Mesorhizobium sp.]
MDVVVLEEHYSDAELDAWRGIAPAGPMAAALRISAEARVARLDKLGITTEILALAPPGLQGVHAPEAAEVARGVNDRLAQYTSEAPDRLAAFAALPTFDPVSAADELRRCVRDLGMVGAMIHGPTQGRFLDDESFAPIFAAAEDLRVPLYVHPSEILQQVREAYFAPYDVTHPMFIRAGWGYTIEAGTHALRLILSGRLQRHPDLKIILGHLGEGIPYMMDRIDEALSRDTPMKDFNAVFRHHFHVTTSGFFSDVALECCVNQIGAERVMFSIDAPYASAEAGMAWLEARCSEAEDATDQARVRALAAGNARALLKL